MATTNNGKLAERLVQTALKGLDTPNFDWQRMYDATSARGGFMAQVGDFEFFLPQLHGVIEVKSTKHSYRLAKGAFSDGQRLRLLQRLRAGGHIWVVVHHWQTGDWRYLPYADVHRAFVDEGKASIDLTGIQPHSSADEVVLKLIYESLQGKGLLCSP